MFTTFIFHYIILQPNIAIGSDKCILVFKYLTMLNFCGTIMGPANLAGPADLGQCKIMLMSQPVHTI